MKKVYWGTDISNRMSDQVFNKRQIMFTETSLPDGCITFHGMSKIAIITPGTKINHHAPRITVGLSCGVLGRYRYRV